MQSEDIDIIAADGRRLSATWYPAQVESLGTVVIAGALGVPRRFYRGLAMYFASTGLAVLTVDYRGIGGSVTGDTLRKDNATLRQWGELDLPAAVAYAAQQGQPVYWMGHSIGGQLLGLIPHTEVRAAVLVASQSGYWGLWPTFGSRAAIFSVWHVLIPLLTLSGRLPMSLLGLGEDVPAGVAREWAQWGRQQKYIMSYSQTLPDDGFRSFRGELTTFAIADDAYAPPSTVQALHDFYQGASRKTHHLVHPSDMGVKELGHFGVFRPKFKNTLWARWRAALLGEAPAVASTEGLHV